MKTPYPSSSSSQELIRLYPCLSVAPAFQLWHYLHGGVTNFIKKTIDHRTVQQDVPTRTRSLTEYHVRDPFATREINQRIRNVARLQFHHARTELLCELNVLLQAPRNLPA